ncbi:MAG: metal-sulfur cluster assembly factor [Candidatus Anstonellales archaeon]
MDVKDIRKMIVEKLESVKDPEFDYNIVELGLIYEIRLDLDRSYGYIKMTLTTPFCPYGNSIINEVNQKLQEIQEIEYIDLDIVFEPEWKPDYMEENPKEKLIETGVFKTTIP